MTRKTRVDPIWVLGNTALAETLNFGLSSHLVAELHEVMEWNLTSDYNDTLWEGLADVNAYDKD